MFHKDKHRRCFTTQADAVPAESILEGEDASFHEISELSRVAAAFDPAPSELDIHQFEFAQYAAEPRSSKRAGDELIRHRKVSEIPAGEPTFHFGCYSRQPDSAIRTIADSTFRGSNAMK
jgi:hypothetical protein